MQGARVRTEPTVWVGRGFDGRAGGGGACEVQERRQGWCRVAAVCADTVVLVRDPSATSSTMCRGCTVVRAHYTKCWVWSAWPGGGFDRRVEGPPKKFGGP